MPFNKGTKILSESISEAFILIIIVCGLVQEINTKLKDNIIIRWIIVCDLLLLFSVRTYRNSVDFYFRFKSLIELKFIDIIDDKDLENNFAKLEEDDKKSVVEVNKEENNSNSNTDIQKKDDTSRVFDENKSSYLGYNDKYSLNKEGSDSKQKKKFPKKNRK